MFANFSTRFPLQQSIEQPLTYYGGISPPTPQTDVSSSPSPKPSSHARRRENGHVRRPPNSFLIFRSELVNKHKYDPTGERDHRTLSQIAGMCWERLSEEQRDVYRKRAEVEKKRHAAQNPGYKYSPVVRRAKKPVKRRLRNHRPNEKERCISIASSWVKDFEVSPVGTTESDPSTAGAGVIPAPPSVVHDEPRECSQGVNSKTPPTPDLFFDFSSPSPPSLSLLFEPTFDNLGFDLPMPFEMQNLRDGFAAIDFNLNSNAAVTCPSNLDPMGLYPLDSLDIPTFEPFGSLPIPYDNGCAFTPAPQMGYGTEFPDVKYPNIVNTLPEMDFGAWFDYLTKQGSAFPLTPASK